MKIEFFEFNVTTTSATDIVDISDRVASCIAKSRIPGDGLVTITIPGSTAAITTIEYEQGVIDDLKAAIERIAPKNIHYSHDSKWGDGNGYAHVRAALLRPSLSIPIKDRKAVLGTWQQIILCDFDNRPRQRNIIVQIIGT